jgi:hypothetical protein
MVHKKVKLVTLFLFGIGLTGIKAQSTLYVREHSGMQTSYTLSSIRKLTVPTGYVTVNKTNGNMSAFALNNIRYLNFNDLTDVSQIDVQGNSNIVIYPNPVVDQLQISYKSIEAGNVQIGIIDMQGKVLYRQTLISQIGINHLLIPVSQLSKGIYVCRLQSDNKTEIIKFIK